MTELGLVVQTLKIERQRERLAGLLAGQAVREAEMLGTTRPSKITEAALKALSDVGKKSK